MTGDAHFIPLALLLTGEVLAGVGQQVEVFVDGVDHPSVARFVIRGRRRLYTCAFVGPS